MIIDAYQKTIYKKFPSTSWLSNKFNFERIVDSVEEMQITMKEIVSQLSAGDFSVSEESCEEFRNDMLALAVTVVDILNGAAYLFKKKPDKDNQHWKMDLELEQFREMLRIEKEDEDG